MHRSIAPVVAAAVLSVLATACATTAPATGSPSPSPAPSETSPGPVRGDWTAPFTLELGSSWTLRACLGDAPDICVDRAGTEVGNLELAQHPLEEGDADADPLEVVRRHAGHFLGSFADDRARGCPAFSFEPDPIVPASVGGTEGVRTGFRLLAADGTVVERVIHHYVVHDGALFLVGTDAYALEGGCLGESEVDLEFEPHVLAAFEPHLDAIVAGTPLPDPTTAG